MKKIFKIIFLLAFMSLGILAFALNKEVSGEILVMENAPETPAKTLYTNNCARCHGADGKAQNELGQTLEATDLTAKKTSVKRNVQVITNGIGAMPAFGRKLNKTEISALANYVRKL